MAKKSVEYNKLENIEVINEDIKNLSQILKDNSVDIITVNPPYRKCDGQKMNENKHLSICNFEVLLPH